MGAFSGEIERQGSLEGYTDEYWYTEENIMIQTYHFYMNSRLSCIHDQVKNNNTETRRWEWSIECCLLWFLGSSTYIKCTYF